MNNYGTFFKIWYKEFIIFLIIFISIFIFFNASFDQSNNSYKYLVLLKYFVIFLFVVLLVFVLIQVKDKLRKNNRVSYLFNFFVNKMPLDNKAILVDLIIHKSVKAYNSNFFPYIYDLMLKGYISYDKHFDKIQRHKKNTLAIIKLSDEFKELMAQELFKQHFLRFYNSKDVIGKFDDIILKIQSGLR